MPKDSDACMWSVWSAGSQNDDSAVVSWDGEAFAANMFAKWPTGVRPAIWVEY